MLNLFKYIIFVFVVHNSHSYVNCNNVVAYIYHVYDVDSYYYWGPITEISKQNMSVTKNWT